MKNFFSIFLFILVVFTGCSQKSFHDEVMEKAKETLNQNKFENIKKSQSESVVKEITPKKIYVSILEDKTLGDILKELEEIDGNLYYLNSTDILVPRSRLKIEDLTSLNRYLKAILNKELFVKKSGPMYLVKLLNSSESKRISIEKIPFKLEGQLSVEELMKLMTSASGFEISIGENIKEIQKFQDSIVTIKCDSIIDAVNSLATTKNVYVDIDYDNEKFIIRRYKNIVIELDVPMLNLTSNSSSTSAETTGTATVSNSSSIVLFDELNSMLTNITQSDPISSFYIDKSSGLIYLKSTKSVEISVREIVNAYENSFSKEATIEFERIELVLNKSREFGITSLVEDRQNATNAGIVKTLDGNLLQYTNDNLIRKLTASAKLDNQIGRIVSYSKNLISLKNNIPAVQSISQNTDYIEQINTTTDTNGNLSTSTTVNTIKDGTSITALAKIARNKIFLNITPNIKKLISLDSQTLNGNEIKLPEYKDQSYNISREVKLGETVIVGSIIVHDDAKQYKGILPMETFAIGGTDSNSYVRKEIVYIVTLKSIKGF